MSLKQIETLHDLDSARTLLGGISRASIMRLKQSGSIGFLKVGGRLFFEESEIAAYLARQRRPATAPISDDGRVAPRPSVATTNDGSEAVDLAAV